MEYPEEERICAFIDILGFSDAMLSDDEDRRQKLIGLLDVLAGRQTKYGHNTIDAGPGWFSYPSAEVTVFSDNVVLSFPTKTLYDEKEVMGMNLPFEPSLFAQHIFAQITSASWKGVELGVLFRGGISFGRLYHNGNVVVGEALVNAVNMEKEASVPRIEVSEEVLNLKSDQGNLIFSDHFQEYCITERDGTKILDTCAFHNGVWRDYVAENDIESIEHAECLNIAESLLSKVNSISNKHRVANNEKVAEKWEWFESYFRDSLNSGIWQEIRTKNK